MKRIIQYMGAIFVALLSTFIIFSPTHGFIGLVAEPGDILDLTIWNNMITELDTKIEAINILPGSGVSITSSGNDVTINANAGAAIAPFLTGSSTPVIVNTSQTIDIQGVYFTPSTVVSIPSPNVTVNSFSATSPSTIQLDITVWGTPWNYDLVLDNAWELNTVWPGNGIWYLTVLSTITGTGPAGTYTETFEWWLWDWFNGWWQQAWTRDAGGTPSGGTWPTTGSSSAFYVYTETSTNGTWFPNRTFILETSNFNEAQSISFDYHAFGPTIWVLELQTLFNGAWTTRSTISGQQQAVQTNPYLNQFVDLSTFPVEAIRFFYTSGTNFTGDLALDNISIISN